MMAEQTDPPKGGDHMSTIINKLRPKGRRSAPSPATIIALIALFMSFGGASYAAMKIGTSQLKDGAVTTSKLHRQAVTTNKLADGSVTTTQLADSAVTTAQLADNAVTSQKVQDDSLTGQDIQESTLAQVPDAAKLAGRAPGAFVSSSVSRHESTIQPGTDLGDGTRYIDEACPAGDVLLNGGPANVAAGSVLVESFPTPGATNSWRARIKPQTGGDNFSVVVLCSNQ
jgi:hypothetical protein